MELKINDTTCNVPTDLSQITLAQFLQYWEQYGRDLDNRLKEIVEDTYTDEFDQTLDLLDLETEEAIAWYSFFTGFDFSIIKQQNSDELIAVYRTIKDLLRASESEAYVLNKEIEWNGDTWIIRDWKITPNSGFTFNELLTSKEAARQIHQLGKGKWEALPYLCAIFFRKKAEPFQDKFIEADSERLTMMKELPMSIAMQVAFFLSVSVTIATTILVSSKEVEPESQD